MKSLEELYRDILSGKVKTDQPLPENYDPAHLDCLLRPKAYAPVVVNKSCLKCEAQGTEYERACRNSCMFDAIKEDEDGKLRIDQDLCAGCEACVYACKQGRLTASKDVLPAMRSVRKAKGNAYALVAPAFFGQFGEAVTAGKLRSAFKALGFSGMVEVALFADILTLKEALEFDRHIQDEGDFQLTSCCCPVWIAMIRNMYEELMPHVPAAVSPMIACGRMIKKLYPEALTVFVGPCLAKKKEAREEDVQGAVDYVLTFQEMQDIFEAADIHLEEMPEDEREHASRAGRLYARTGGVSEAVASMTQQLRSKKPHVRSEQAEGTKACMEMIQRIKKGETNANFFEGMGCIGGCVGGPKTLLKQEEGRTYVDEYAEASCYKTPLENPYVRKMLEELGLNTIEELIEDPILERDFSKKDRSKCNLGRRLL